MLSRRTVLRAGAISAALGMASPRAARPDAAIVPAYFGPDYFPAEWELLADPRIYAVILNVANGPGDAPNPVFAAAVRRIEERGGTVAGYVDVGYGRRDPALIEADVRRYRSWYHVADIFCDQVPAGPDMLPIMQQVSDRLRGADAEFIAFNHGVYPDPGYGALADLLVTFEGPLASYPAVQPPAWTMTGPRQRFCHLVYGVAEPEVDAVLTLARRRNTGVVYVTDHTGSNPYGGLPSYFPRLLTL
ncbi:spherulation-specific family 4 protein [Actinocorallia longicatena]|uniref:Spherulation-specific family 4 protein n=1 Tax=Actinocorallia longicatena TaxID=111803 RepID=A0ABP6QI60_9ACTN